LPTNQPWEIDGRTRSYLIALNGNLGKISPAICSSPLPSASTSTPTSTTPKPCPILLPHLTHLDLSHCPELRGGDLCRLVAQRFTSPAYSIHRLTPSSSSSSDKEPGKAILSGQVARLETLLVDGCPYVDEVATKWLGERVPRFSCRLTQEKKKRKGLSMR
jgi:hypothetical protein